MYWSTYILLRRRQWQPTPVLLPGKSHGWRSLVGCSPWGRKESDTTERLRFHFSLSCIGEGNGNPLQRSCLENPRDGSLVGCRLCGRTESDMTEVTQQHILLTIPSHLAYLCLCSSLADFIQSSSADTLQSIYCFLIQEYDTSRQYFFDFQLVHEAPTYRGLSPLVCFKYLMTVEWLALSSSATSCVVIRGSALMMALNWSLSTSDGQPLYSSS